MTTSNEQSEKHFFKETKYLRDLFMNFSRMLDETIRELLTTSRQLNNKYFQSSIFYFFKPDWRLQ